MKHKRIIFVCTGNTCRSPMAEAAFRKELRRRRISGFLISSAGIDATPGSTVSPNSVQALNEAEIPLLKTFKPCKLTEQMISEAYAVICMTESQRLKLQQFRNVFSFYQICGKEIPDPYGQSIDVYRVTLRKIRECIPRIIAAFHLEESAEAEKKKNN